MDYRNKQFFMSDCNCSYTASNGRKCRLSLEALFGIMEQIPERPKILTIPINVVSHDLLPKNTIFISNDIAAELEIALKEK